MMSKLSGIAFALISICVMTVITGVSAQWIQKVSALSPCANKIVNGGAFSNKPGGKSAYKANIFAFPCR